MKKTMIIAAAALVAGSALAAEVLSANGVGFIQTTCPADQYTALSYPFYGSETNGGTKFIDTPIAQDAAVGSQVYFWNGSGWAVGEYVQGRTGAAWDATAKAKVLAPGEGFLYKPAADQDAMVSGEIPDDNTIELGITGGGSYTALGLPYPAEKAWIDTEIAASAPIGAQVYFWNGSGWAVGEYVQGRTGAAWDATAKGKTLKAGEGFLYKLPDNAADAEVSMVRPYDWPAEVEIVNP
jgi:hypothetical protein